MEGKTVFEADEAPYVVVAEVASLVSLGRKMGRLCLMPNCQNTVLSYLPPKNIGCRPKCVFYRGKGIPLWCKLLAQKGRSVKKMGKSIVESPAGLSALPNS